MTLEKPITVEKPWGHETIWALCPKFCGKVLSVKAGHQLSLQYHRRKEEAIYVLSGELKLVVMHSHEKIPDHLGYGTYEEIHMVKGDCYHIPIRLIHRMVAITDVEIAEVSTPEIDDVVRISDDYGRSA